MHGTVPSEHGAAIIGLLAACQPAEANKYTVACMPVHLAKAMHLKLLPTPAHLLQAAELLAQATSGRRTLRERRPQMPCPSCKLDIAEFMSTAQINL